MSDRAPTCSTCGVDMEPNPRHPGSGLGDWYMHPEPRMPFGHTHATLIPRGDR